MRANGTYVRNCCTLSCVTDIRTGLANLDHKLQVSAYILACFVGLTMFSVGIAHRGRRRQHKQSMGLSAGDLPQEHETGLENCDILLLKTIGVARWPTSGRAMCPYPWWRKLHQLHDVHKSFSFGL